MSTRTYNQYCGLAATLDLLGERWTLLIVRNLLRGPKRFKDLEDGLPGIGTSLLSARLKQLQSADVIERTTLPPPAASTVYRLTSDGEALRGVILEMARWGLARLGPPDDQAFLAPDLMMLALEARYSPTHGDDVDGQYELHVDGAPFQVDIRDNAITIRAGQTDTALATITTDTTTLAELNNGSLPLQDAVTSGKLAITGDLDRTLKLASRFGLA
ncbi:winged helix-turn-helix transcriptional regulator [Actinocorallia lasiicapitis]